jgi:uncharacterized damage-inducible protein DinB
MINLDRGTLAMQDSDAVVSYLKNAPSLLISVVREIPPEIIKRRPRAGKWSAHEHACHLSEVHPVFFLRLEQMLSSDRPRIKPYDPEHDMATHDALLQMDLNQSLNRYESDRRQLVEKLKRLNPADWQRPGEHPEYSRYSIFIMCRHLAFHDLFHAYQIEELMLKRDWEPTTNA